MAERNNRPNHNLSTDLSHPSLKENKQDDPPNSRLFIVCGKSVTEDDFREAFHKFGTIEEIWMVKDRTSGEPKGIFSLCLLLNIDFLVHLSFLSIVGSYYHLNLIKPVC